MTENRQHIYALPCDAFVTPRGPADKLIADPAKSWLGSEWRIDPLP
jgi:hypothetical protein